MIKTCMLQIRISIMKSSSHEKLCNQQIREAILDSKANRDVSMEDIFFFFIKLVRIYDNMTTNKKNLVDFIRIFFL